MKRRLFFIFICFITGIKVLYSQDNYLNDLAVYHLTSDSNGVIFMASDNGVHEYNGIRFNQYGREHGIPELEVFRLDAQGGKIWVGTFDPTVGYLHNGKYYPFKYNDSLKKNFPERSVKKGFYTGKNKDLYISDIGYGMIKVDSLGNVKHIGKIKSNVFDFGDKVLVGTGRTFNFKKPRATDYSGIHVFKGEYHDKFFDRPLNISNHKLNQGPFFGIKSSTGNYLVIKGGYYGRISGNNIYHIEGRIPQISIYQDWDNSIWIGCREKGVYIFRDELLKDTIGHFLNGFSVTSIYRDFQNGYWISTLESGVFHFPIHPNKISNIGPKTKVLKIVGLTEGRCAALYEDGTTYEIERDQFRLISQFAGDAKSEKSVLHYDRHNKNLLVKNSAYPITATAEYKILAVNQIGKLSSNSRIYNVFSSSKGEQFVIHYKGIHKADAPGYPEIEGSSVFEYNKVQSMVEWNDTIFIGVGNGMYFLFNKEINLLKSKWFDNLSISSMAASSNFMVAALSSGNLVIRSNENTQSTQLFPFKWKVNALDIKRDTLWIGSDNGLFLLNLKGKALELMKISEQQGFHGSKVTALHTDLKHIYLGSASGLTVLNKGILKINVIKPRLTLRIESINGLKQFEKDLSNLRYTENNLDVYLSTISYTDNISLKYAYKVEGIDNNWNELDGRRLSFKNLEPGRYKVLAKCSTLPGEWSEISELSFQIKPPFWVRWWFVLLEIVFGCGLVVVFIRFRIKKEKQQSEKELKILREKSDLELKFLRAQMNPHFIFNAMNTILSLIKQEKNKDAERYLIELSTLLRSITEQSPNSKIPLKQELEITEKYFAIENLRFGSDLEFRIDVNDKIDMNKILIPGLILQPFVENAIVHGLRNKEGKKLVKIQIDLEKSNLKCTIEDNGIGRKKASEITATRKISRKSVGISNSSQRLRLINSSGKEELVSMKIEDLYDNNGQAKGTKVILNISISI